MLHFEMMRYCPYVRFGSFADLQSARSNVRLSIPTIMTIGRKGQVAGFGEAGFGAEAFGSFSRLDKFERVR